MVSTLAHHDSAQQVTIQTGPPMCVVLSQPCSKMRTCGTELFFLRCQAVENRECEKKGEEEVSLEPNKEYSTGPDIASLFVGS